jgi:uncharacterized protein involved in exopolysaccharide biosynthesis
MEKQNYYLDLWRYRKKYFLIPFLFLAVVATVIIFKLPKIYESKSIILIEEQQIPPEFVRSTVTGFAESHIQILTQQILSRSRLQEIIDKFKLFPEMQKKSTREEIVEKMRKDIEFKTISAKVRDKRQAGAESVTIAFSVAYQGKDPATVQKVAGTLASLYLEQNLKYREAQAQSTTVFLQTELKELEEKISQLGEKIALYKEQYGNMLPELQQFNLSQAERLENEVKNLDNAIRTGENQKIFLEGLIATSGGEGDGGNNPQLNPRARLRALEVLITDLRSKFSEEHPDLQKALREKTQLEKVLHQKGGGDQKQQRLLKLQAELAQKQGVYSDQHPDVRKLQEEITLLRQEVAKGGPPSPETNPNSQANVNLVAQLQTVKNDIITLKQQQQNLRERLQNYRQRVETSPKIEQPYLVLTRDYQDATMKYREVMNKLLEARIGEGMEEHQKGGKFTLIEAAAIPEKPVKPKRPLLMVLGLIVAGVAGGVCIVGVDKIDHSIRSAGELAALTEMPPLGVIARIETPFDLTEKVRRRRLLLLAICCSLSLGILAIHFFFMDLWIVAAKFLGLYQKIS